MRLPPTAQISNKDQQALEGANAIRGNKKISYTVGIGVTAVKAI